MVAVKKKLSRRFSTSPPSIEEDVELQGKDNGKVETTASGKRKRTLVKEKKATKKVSSRQEEEEDAGASDETPPLKKSKRGDKKKTEGLSIEKSITPPPKKPKRAIKKAKIEEESEEDVKIEEKLEEEVKIEDDEDGKTVVNAKAKRSVKKTKAVDTGPLAPRTTDTKLRVGAHVSILKGVQNSVTNMIRIGGNAFALFLKSQRKWDNPPLVKEQAEQFIDRCKSNGIDAGKCCLPHGSYLVNLAHPAEDRKAQAYGSFLDDLTRCHRLGIKLYNFHPGNASASTHEEGIQLIAAHINKAHSNPETGEVIPVLETMATLGNTIGGTFQDLADIIALVDNKERVGVCLDTAHVYAAGYDIRDDWNSVMDEFDNIIGLKYLKAFHMNDSKAPKDSNFDRHANIGTGYLGLKAFHNIVNDPRLHGIPMILETPNERTVDGKKVEDQGVWAREIKLLESLVGADLSNKEFTDKITDLQKEGEDERERFRVLVERRVAKEAKAANKKSKGESKGKKANKKSKKEESDDEDLDDEED